MKSIIIFTFMIKDLKLKGSELLIYALIYSFSQFADQYCFMKPESIAKELGLSRSQVFRSLSSLLEKGFIFTHRSGFRIKKSHDLDEYINNQREELEEIIRIAKTPWLERRSNW